MGRKSILMLIIALLIWSWFLCLPGGLRATCTPGVRDTHAVGVTNPWVGTVPKAILPTGHPCGSYTHGVLAFESTGCSWTPVNTWYGTDYYVVWWVGTGQCAQNGYMRAKYHVNCINYSNGTQDYDCDTIWDEVDPNPGNDPDWDSDGDGYKDSQDPWPNDPTLPGSQARWKRVAKTKHKTLDATFTWYEDTLGAGGLVYTATGPDVEQLVNLYGEGESIPADDVTYEWLNGPTTTWATGPGQNNDATAASKNPASEIQGENAEFLRTMKDMSTGLSGKLTDIYTKSSDIKTGVDGTNTRIEGTNTKLDGIGGKLDGLGGKLDGIKSSIDGQQFPSLTGVESRLDTANTKLGTANEKLDQIKNIIPVLGDGDLPEGETGELEDQSEFNEEAGGTKGETIKTAFTEFLDDYISNNPIFNWISRTGVSASGGQSSVSFTVRGNSYTLDASWLGGKLGDIGAGTFFIALCTFAGIVAVLRD